MIAFNTISRAKVVIAAVTLDWFRPILRGTAGCAWLHRGRFRFHRRGGWLNRCGCRFCGSRLHRGGRLCRCRGAGRLRGLCGLRRLGRCRGGSGRLCRGLRLGAGRGGLGRFGGFGGLNGNLGRSRRLRCGLCRLHDLCGHIGATVLAAHQPRNSNSNHSSNANDHVQILLIYRLFLLLTGHLIFLYYTTQSHGTQSINRDCNRHFLLFGYPSQQKPDKSKGLTRQ